MCSPDARLFAGAKETALIDDYKERLKLDRFDLLIDWGWFYFITKPVFLLIDYLFKLLGNFGLAILAVTVIIKIAFFPLCARGIRCAFEAIPSRRARLRGEKPVGWSRPATLSGEQSRKLPHRVISRKRPGKPAQGQTRWVTLSR